MQDLAKLLAPLLLAGALAAVAPALAAAPSPGAARSTTAHPPTKQPCARTRRHNCHYFSVSSWQWGVGRGITSPTSTSADREGSTPSVGEINVHKPKRH